MAIKMLIGGSPCTHWSIAQTKKRETTAEGIGWELFRNYLIAKEKFQPDFFLYENNKSAAQPIKDQIARELGVELMYINSALVSAQNRQRFYAFNWDVAQPEDRGILLRDILETGTAWKEKGYALAANRGGHCLAHDITESKYAYSAEPVRVCNIGKGRQGERIYDSNAKSCAIKANGGGLGGHGQGLYAEPVNVTADGKAQCIRATCYKDGIRNLVGNTVDLRTCVAEPAFEYVDYTPRDKSHIVVNNNGIRCALDRNGAGASESFVRFTDVKCGTLTTAHVPKCIEPVRVGTMPNQSGEINKTQSKRIYSDCGNARCLQANAHGCGNTDISAPATGLYAIRCENVGDSETIKKALPEIANKIGYIPEMFNAYNRAEITTKSPTLSTGSMVTSSCATCRFEKTDKPIYEVNGGFIAINGKTYPIKLADGYYIIRKLTPIECERLQTMPDNYTAAVSNTQRYKGLGNGWTAEVIIHILQGALKDVPKDEKIIVLSMYDGIGTGRYCLDKMGFTNVEYHAYEIDKYAKQIAMSNYPDIIQHGDAFSVREEEWSIT